MEINTNINIAQSCKNPAGKKIQLKKKSTNTPEGRAAVYQPTNWKPI